MTTSALSLIGLVDAAGSDEGAIVRAFDAWRGEVRFSDRLVEAAPTLDITGDEPGEGPVTLRWVLAHLLEE